MKIRNAAEFLEGDVMTKVRAFAVQLYEEHGRAEPFAFAKVARNPNTLEAFDPAAVLTIRPDAPIATEADAAGFLGVIRAVADRAGAEWVALVMPGSATFRAGPLERSETVLVQVQHVGAPVRSALARVMRHHEATVVLDFTEIEINGLPWLRALVPSPGDKPDRFLS